MGKIRPKNKQNELQILVRNKRACCVCHSSNGPIHIHHIDGDPAHLALDNLAVLCIPHHDQATAGLRSGTVGLGKKLTPEEVRFHKRVWEKAVESEIQRTRRATYPRKSKDLLILFEFELLRVRTHIFSERSEQAIANWFAYLDFWSDDSIHSLPQYRALMLNTYGELGARGFGVRPIALGVINGLRFLCLGVGVIWKRSRSDYEVLAQSARIMGQVGYWVIVDAREPSTLEQVCKGLLEVLEKGLTLNFKQIKSEIQISLSRMEQELRKLPPRQKASPNAKAHSKQISSTLAVFARMTAMNK
jgi:hypothetical protein